MHDSPVICAVWLQTLEPRLGETITLQCQVPSNANIKAVNWTKTDLGPQNVIFYRDEQLDTDNQHQSFKNRVQLDNEPKGGNLSLVLKNVSSSDYGRYECSFKESKGEGKPHQRHITVHWNPQEEVAAAVPGEDVPLLCQTPRDADIKVIVWSRSDLGSDYVFFYRDESPHENFQHPSYRGRVELSDPEMKDGDVSVVLKNVSVKDTGTYECRVIITEGEEPKLYSTIKLTVSVSGEFVELSLCVYWMFVFSKDFLENRRDTDGVGEDGRDRKSSLAVGLCVNWWACFYCLSWLFYL
uniref:Ig-like domain-containing protein n=1 Tax=Sander lucioperca TaxID=283035 RepID=A0A8C9ZWN3_SANLU